MFLTDLYELPIGLSLAIIALVLLLSIIASLVFPKKAEAHSSAEHDPLAPTLFTRVLQELSRYMQATLLSSLRSFAGWN